MKYSFFVGMVAFVLIGCGTTQNTENPNTPENTSTDNSLSSSSDTMNTPTPRTADSVTQLEITTLTEGSGAEAKVGDRVVVHYTGTFLDGTKFDSSRDRNQPFSLILGAKQVITGWDQGLVGMKTGEVRQLLIPYSLAYGENGYPPVIPPRSPLQFEVELIEIQ